MNFTSMAATGLSPISCRDMMSFSGKSKQNVKSIWIQRFAVSNTMKKIFYEKGRFKKKHEEEVNPYLRCKELKEESRKSLKDYCEETKDLIRSDGGPPRWFSPLECGSHSDDSPLLLFLPGIDGVGLGLIRQHQRLGKIFDVWCLHIPVMDRTTFTDLVMLVEKTVRSEYNRLPNRPIYLVGESLGGCLALSVAASNPDIDLVLILANPATSFRQSPLQPLISLLELMTDQLYVTVLSLLSSMLGDPLKMVMDIMVKGLPPQQIFAGLSQDSNAMPSYLSVLADIFPRDTLLWKLQMLNSASAFVNSQLHIVKAQTLILSSGRDQLLPGLVEGERLCHTLSNCEIRSFYGSGHLLFLEDGVDLVSIIKGAYFYRRGKYLNYVSDYMPVTPSEFNKLDATNRWTEVITSPVMLSTLKDGKIVRGLAGIPSEGPVLVVGYHMFMGIEVIPMMCQFLAERNINLRGIAHPLMFKNLRGGKFPVASFYDNFKMLGAVPASATNFCKLLSSKSHVLLYPGGMRESLHRKGEEYKLFWPEQSEFVRMAARFGAKIIPFGVVGEDDVGEIFFDYNDQMKIPLLKSLIELCTNKAAQLRTDANGEVANQDLHLPGFLLKYPGRFYYYFGKPIEMKGRMEELRDKEKSQELYLQVKSEVERCIAFLKEKRKSDPFRNLLPRLVYQATHDFMSEVPTFEF